MRSCVLMLLLAATGASAAQVRVALPGLTAVQLEEKLAGFLNEQLAQELVANGGTVITSKEISALLGMERQKQLVGCDDAQSSACMAELANALGTDAVLIGDVARVGTRYQVTLKAISGSTGQRVSDFSAGGTKEEELLGLVAEAARKMAPEIASATGRSLGKVTASAVVAQPAPRPKRAADYAWIPLSAGAAALAGAVVLEGVAYGQYREIQNGTGDFGRADSLRSSGKALQASAYVLGAVGLAAIVTGGVLKFGAGDEKQPSAALAVSPLGVAISGVFP